MSRALILQARKSIAKLINESPEHIIIYRKPLILSSFGQYVESPTAEPEPKYLKVRISHIKNYLVHTETSPAGFTQDLQRYILVDHNTKILDGDLFEASNGVKYRIGKIDPLIKFGGVIGYQAPLLEANDVNT